MPPQPVLSPGQDDPVSICHRFDTGMINWTTLRYKVREREIFDNIRLARASIIELRAKTCMAQDSHLPPEAELPCFWGRHIIQFVLVSREAIAGGHVVDHRTCPKSTCPYP